jgi:hypothetical protein
MLHRWRPCSLAGVVDVVVDVDIASIERQTIKVDSIMNYNQQLAQEVDALAYE